MTQTQRIIDFIERHGKITQRDAIGLGCYRLSARIHDIRQSGIMIKSETKSVRNADGSHSNIAVYSFAEKVTK